MDVLRDAQRQKTLVAGSVRRSTGSRTNRIATFVDLEGGEKPVGRGSAGPALPARKALDASLDRGEIAGLQCLGQAGSNQIQVDIGSTGQLGRIVAQPYPAKSPLPEAALLVFFPIGHHGQRLAQQTHPPADVAQPPANRRQPIGIVADRVQFGRRRFLGISVGILAQGADHQPPPGDLGIVPGGHHIGTGAEDEVEMVGEDAETEQIDAEGRGKPLEAVFQPLFAMIVIGTGDGILSHQEAPPHTALDDVDDGDFVRIEDF